MQPLALTRYQGHVALVLNDPGGEPLSAQLGQPVDIQRVLSLAIGIIDDLRQMHAHGLIHEDIQRLFGREPQLHGLAREGNMRKIIQWAERLAASDERYRAFAAQLADLAKQYQSRTLLQLVEAQLERAVGTL